MSTAERVAPDRIADTEIRGVRVGNASALRAMLPRGAVVADLYLGAWRPHSAASQFAARLGRRVGRSYPGSASAERGGYGARVGAFVDAEALGDTRLLHAWEMAQELSRVAEAAGRVLFYLIAPAAPAEWEPEDEALVRHLAPALSAIGGALVLVASTRGEPPVGPSGCRVDWPNVIRGVDDTGDPVEGVDADALDLLPGVIDAAIALALGPLTPGTYVALDDGAVVVGPERRRLDGSAARKGLSRASRHDEWLRAYAQWAAPNGEVDRAFLMTLAWKAFDRDAGGLALRLADRAARAAVGPEELASLRVQTHHMRIALGRFTEVARDAAAPAVLAPMSRGLYLQAHGWALVMVGEHDRAQRELVSARSLLRPLSGSVEYLYLLNITALNLLRLGDVEGALSLEREVERGARTLAQRDHRLEYINAINIARLQRRIGDLDEAARYYARAFATVAGSRSESDAVLANFTSAKLRMEQGRPDLAYGPIVRAALHFSASVVPDALSPRLVRTVTGANATAAHARPAAMAAALLDQLNAIARTLDAGVVPEVPASEPPVFMRSDDPRAIAIARSGIAAGTEEWGLLVSPTATPAPSASPAQERLRAALAVHLTRHLGAFRTAVVDDRFGREIPTTASELIDVALRSQTRIVRFGRRELHLDDDARDRLVLSSRVRLGPAVDRVVPAESGDTVFFKRYREPLKLSPAESGALRSLAAAPTIGEMLAPSSGLSGLDAIRHLEEARVLTVSADAASVI